MNHWTDLNKTYWKCSLDVPLQLFTFWSRPDPRWTLQPTELEKHKKKKTASTVKFSDFVLKFSVVVAES